MININSINPNLKRFIFESQIIVLKNAFTGYSYRCYTKSLNGILYQYLTIIPNCGYKSNPVDILTSFDGKDKKAYILVGQFVDDIHWDEFSDLYKKIEQLVELEGHMEIPSKKINEIINFYNSSVFGADTIESIKRIYQNFYQSLDESYSSEFIKHYYNYYKFVEQSRLERIKLAHLAPKVRSFNLSNFL